MHSFMHIAKETNLIYIEIFSLLKESESKNVSKLTFFCCQINRNVKVSLLACGLLYMRRMFRLLLAFFPLFYISFCTSAQHQLSDSAFS